MPNFPDIVYGAGLALSAPVWLLVPKARRKVLGAMRGRMGLGLELRGGGGDCVLIHAVSLGEINATPSLVEGLRAARPGLRFVISSTTDTGFARALQIYGSHAEVSVIRYPLDFSWAVERVLDGVRPSVIALMELEVWPNFVGIAARRGIPVVLLNGRLTMHSFSRYRLIRPIAASMLRKLAALCVQDELYASRFVQLGAPAERVRVTGTMKFDTALMADRVEGDGEMARELGLAPRAMGGDEVVWVCGSTGPGEEEIVLRVYRRLLASMPLLRLVIVPRKPERFDEVAGIIGAAGLAFARRSRKEAAADGAIVLGDTLGELRKFYSMADVVFVGRSLVDLGPRQHGSDMIEPAALGKACVVGPFTGNFAEAMNRFREAGAVLEVASEEELFASVSRLLGDEVGRKEMGVKARSVVEANRGATGRHVAALLGVMGFS